MHIIKVRNVHEALPHAVKYLKQSGVLRDSRNGPVLMSPVPVTTVYERPTERVIFHPERDANPFFHLYESLWMIAGRNDVEGPARYARQMREYSDDGVTFHGAYGYRWRSWFGHDQLQIIAEQLSSNPNDRRCVLSMWDSESDLGNSGKDVPCNLTATLQVDTDGRLNLVVFNRSNDIVWGAYGANAVHFSFLLEYLAHLIGREVGTYTQISVNWHAYLGTFKQVEEVVPDKAGFVSNPYERGVTVIPMTGDVDVLANELLYYSDVLKVTECPRPENEWYSMIFHVLRAHLVYRKTVESPDRYVNALLELEKAPASADWVIAAKQWMRRRLVKFETRYGAILF